MKPIHKFNNGNGATLCHCCRTIISTDFIDKLYCSKECEGAHTYKPKKDNPEKK
jgi:hypothetical protein